MKETEMKPENVTDAALDAFKLAQDEAYEGYPAGYLYSLCCGIAAAINAMPLNPELERLRSENEALKQSIQHESDVVEAAKEEIIRHRVENAKQSEKIDALRSENDGLRSMAHRLALDLECLLLSTDNPAATKWWAEANATLDLWRAMQESKP